MARRKKQNEDEASQEDQDNFNSNDADDTFGLPEVAYEPLKREEEPAYNPPAEEPAPTYEPEPEPIEEPVYETSEEVSTVEEQYEQEEHREPEYHSRYSYMEDTRDQPMWPKILAVVLLVLLAGSAIYYFAVYKPGKDREDKIARELRDKQQKEADEAARRQREAEELRLAAEQRRADSLANIPKIGSVEKLSSRTGQYWVIVASAIDDDLLMDRAQKLAKDGKQVRIIPPFGKQPRFHRLAIDSKDNYADAQAVADGLKGGEFGDQLWVVKY